uniref:GCR337 n=1 Tax=Schmidtea mediterranea TaxID=79327 RepID=A0A193KUS4_SCHMD|nr:GCR337 [Schmidtea mediterranea]
MNNSYSSPVQDVSVYYKVLFSILFSIVFIVGIGGNYCICWILIKDINRNATNIFLFNLSLADILMCLICSPVTLVSDGLLFYWPFGSLLCKVVPFIQGISVFLSGLTHVVISSDRFVVVFFPMKTRLSNECSWGLIGLTWIISIILSLPLVIVNEISTINQNRDLCEENWKNKDHGLIYTFVVLICQYFLPVAFITSTYIAIAVKLWIRKPPGVSFPGRNEQVNNSKKRMVKMVIIVASFYSLSQLPRHVLFLIGYSNELFFSSKHVKELLLFSHFLSISATTYNIFIYLWLNRNFKESFVKSFLK